jgi:hypothetical protein
VQHTHTPPPHTQAAAAAANPHCVASQLYGIPLNLWTKFDELLVQAILGNQNFSFFVAGEQLVDPFVE